MIRRRTEAIDAAAARGHERPTDAAAPQHVDHAIDGVAFPDAAGIDFDPRAIEPHRVACSVQDDVTRPDARAGAINRRRFRHEALALEKPPDFHERADGDVKGAVASAAVVRAGRKEVEQFL
jgi:hypothetical protein